MANCAIKQSPLWNVFTAGEDIIFVVSNTTAVANETKVKFIAQVHISKEQPNLSTTADIVGDFKTTPNNAGVGIFNLRNILENYVKADNLAVTGSASGSTYKRNYSAVPLPIHLIDRFSLNTSSIRNLGIQFKVEFLDQDITSNTYGQIITTGTQNSSTSYKFFNGYLKYTDELDFGAGTTNFGYAKIDDFYPAGSSGRFLTNAPTTQYANYGDYGTLAVLTSSSGAASNVRHAEIFFYNAAGVVHGTSVEYNRTAPNGAFNTWTSDSENEILYVGCFPGNVEQMNPTTWATVVAWGMTHYKVMMTNSSNSPSTESITINLNCPNEKGYESIRLCWLNQWGVWDYYTFTQKSVRSISTQGSTYQQLGGTWNESIYRISSYKGGKKAFRRNVTEKIKMNTNFVSEDDNVMFEELINSPEVYLLQGLQTDTYSALNQYVTPVRVTNSTFTRKTIANDKLMQYTFEIEKSKTLRTQSI